ncbi:MAG: YicC/YloC family endoribonuclease [Woeseiaceae bacterium]
MTPSRHSTNVTDSGRVTLPAVASQSYDLAHSKTEQKLLRKELIETATEMNERIHSMTGFARAERETPNAMLCWELRSVNHRYLDVSLRLHDSLRALEPAMRTEVGQQLNRGKVDCVLSISFNASEQPRLDLDLNLLRSLRDASLTIDKTYGGAKTPSLIDVMKWPGVIRESKPDGEALKDEIIGLLQTALQSLAEMRQREGAHLKETLLTRCDDIERLASDIAARRSIVVDAMQSRIREKVAKLDVEANPDRLEQELVLLAQKLDIDEELDRLTGHSAELRNILAEGGPCGRKLDFLIQEFNREANTIGSKSADGDTTKAIVDMKVAIEQMREQVQNIE